jgi:hypothetical protein
LVDPQGPPAGAHSSRVFPKMGEGKIYGWEWIMDLLYRFHATQYQQSHHHNLPTFILFQEHNWALFYRFYNTKLLPLVQVPKSNLTCFNYIGRKRRNIIVLVGRPAFWAAVLITCFAALLQIVGTVMTHWISSINNFFAFVIFPRQKWRETVIQQISRSGSATENKSSELIPLCYMR